MFSDVSPIIPLFPCRKIGTDYSNSHSPLLIFGQPYNLAKEDWLEKHPGGKYILEITKGTDCTELFESYHAASLQGKYITDKLAKHKLPALRDDGPLVQGPQYEWDAAPLYEDIKKVVREYRKEHGVKAVDKPGALAWYAVWGVIHYTTLARYKIVLPLPRTLSNQPHYRLHREYAHMIMDMQRAGGGGDVAAPYRRLHLSLANAIALCGSTAEASLVPCWPVSCPLSPLQHKPP